MNCPRVEKDSGGSCGTFQCCITSFLCSSLFLYVWHRHARVRRRPVLPQTLTLTNDVLHYPPAQDIQGPGPRPIKSTTPELFPNLQPCVALPQLPSVFLKDGRNFARQRTSEPLRPRQGEPHLAATENLLRKLRGKRPTQKHFRCFAKTLAVAGNREHVSGQNLIDERNAELERVRHAHLITVS